MDGAPALSRMGRGERLRVLIVTPRAHPDVGGVETHVLETAPRLAAAGAEVTVLTTDRSGRRQAEEMIEGVRIVRVRAMPEDRDYYFAPGVYRYIRSTQWDIVHCQSYHTLVFPLAMLAARRSRVPCVVSFHSGGHDSSMRPLVRRLQHLLLRRQLRAAERLVCVSDFERSRFARILGLPAERFEVIPNGCDLPDPGPVEAGGSRLIASIGRLERYKGHHRLIRALPRVLSRYPDARALIVGDGSYREELVALAQRLGVADAVEFRSIPSEDRLAMARVMRQAALVVLLSEYESAGMAILEAIGLGTPALVNDATALHGVTAAGWADAVAQDADDADVAQAIVSSLSRPPTPAALPSAPVPTWDECAAGLLRVYQSVDGIKAQSSAPEPVGHPARAQTEHPEGVTGGADDRLRVLMVTPRDPRGPGGVERHVIEVSRRMVAAGATVQVLCADASGDGTTEQTYQGVMIRAVRGWPRGRDYYLAPRIWHEMGREQWDIVHIQSYHTLVAPVAMLRALALRIPYVLTFHGGGHSSRLRQRFRGLQRRALRPLLVRAGRLVALARFEIELYGRELRVPRTKFALIPNGTNLTSTDVQRADSRSLGTQLASVGRLERYKGHQRAIAALPYVLERRQDVRLLIVGTGPYRAALRRQAMRLRLGDSVDFTSVAPHDSAGMTGLMQQVSLVVLLSDFETQPLVALEAAAAGCRLLVSDRAGLREFAEDGYARAVPGDARPEVIGHAILEELANPERAPRLMLSDWDDCSSALLDLYASVIARSRRAGEEPRVRSGWPRRLDCRPRPG